MPNQKQDVPEQSLQDWEKLQEDELESVEGKDGMSPEYLLLRYLLDRYDETHPNKTVSEDEKVVKQT